MAIFKICGDDILVNTLQKVFKANIVRVPEAKIRPLSVLAITPKKPHFWGYLEEFTESPLPNYEAALQESQMADISGKRSKDVKAELGLQILDGFLKGYNLPSAAISSKFTGAKTVSFSFQEVVRYFISPGKIGGILKGQALDVDNGSNAIFLQKEARLFLIDSVIKSKDFSIIVEKTNSNDFSLDIRAIQQIIGQANTGVHIESHSGLDLSFHGSTPLSFAFTCIECILDAAGRINIKPVSSTVTLDQPEAHTMLFETPGMVELDMKKN